MRIRDVSLRTRLWAANFLMVLVPVCALAILGASLTAFLQVSGASRMSALAMLWPEKGPSLSVQYLTSDLRARATHRGADAGEKRQKHPSKTIAKMAEDCAFLEQQGLAVAILQRGEVRYVTEGQDVHDLMRRVEDHIGRTGSGDRWDETGFFARYEPRPHDMAIFIAGHPARYPESDEMGALTPKDLLKAALWTILALSIAVTILLGRWLSRMLSEQVLAPLSALRSASAAIREGDLNHALSVRAQDEVGMACADFERMRQDLKRAKAEEIRYEHNRKELIAGISHDLRTPLTALKGYVSGLRDGIAQTPVKRQHYLDMMHESVETLEHLVESLFLFSKLDLGKVPFHLERLHLAPYLEHFVAEQRAAFRADTELSLRAPAARDLALVDPMQFARVLRNLLDNSRKYRTGAKARVEILLEHHAGTIQLTWRDHGRGVKEEHLARLFASFYRTDEARSNVADGSGLGLAIAKAIITAMQGSIRAEQAPTGGLTTIITLPCAQPEAAEQKGTSA